MAEDKKSFGSKLGSLLLPGKKDEELSPKDESIITAIGALMTGLVNIDDPAKLKGQVKSKGTAKPQNTGLLGMIAKMTDSLNVITGKKKVNDFTAIYSNLEEQQKFIKENVFADSNKDFFKNLGKFGKSFDKVGGNIDKIIELMNKPPAEGEGKKLDVDIEGSSDFAKMLDSLKEFDLGDKNEESIDELSKMTQKNGSLSMIFEGIGGLNKNAPNFNEFVENVKDMDKANSEIVAVGEENNAEKMKAVMQNLGEVAKVILAMCAVGLLLVVVGLISQWLDFGGILKFTGILLLFLAGTMAIFVIAANSLKGNSEVMQGIKSYTFLVIVSAGILIFGSLIMRFINMGDLIKFTASLLLFLLGLVGVYALMNMASKNTMQGVKEFTLLVVASAIVMFLGAMFNNMIPFGDVIGFTLKLGLFLLMITGIMILWNLVKKSAAEGIKDAIIAVGLAAFILFLGAFSFKVLNVGDLLGFIFYLGVFLFGIVIVMLATSIAMRIAGTGGQGLIGQIILLVVAAAFIMFLGAACFKAIDKLALVGFIAMFDFFLGSLIAILMPLIVTTGIWEKGAEVIKSIALFVAAAAAVMLIGGGLIMLFPMLLLTIPAFILLLDFFLASLVIILTPLVAVAGIFPLGFMSIRYIAKFVQKAALTMMVGGLLIVFFPDLIWAIPLFILYANLMIMSIAGVMVAIGVILNEGVIRACAKAMNAIRKTIMTVSIAFGILALVMKLIKKNGGFGQFTLLLLCLVGTVSALAGVMILLGKLLKEKELAMAAIALAGICAAVLLMSVAFGVLAAVLMIINKAGGLGKFVLLVVTLCSVLALLSAGIVVLAYALGNPLTAALAMVAIAVVLAAAKAFEIVANAMLRIAIALKILSTIKKFDMSPLIKGVASLTLLTAALAPLALAMPIILMASLALSTLAMVVSTMAKAVQEYAELKITVYEGTKAVGYRKLKESDFQEAAKNVSLIVTTLTEGIMQAYEAHPEWYGATGLGSLINNWMNGGQTPLERVIRQSKMLGPLVSAIAEAVKDYADLKIKIYEGTEVKGYRSLKTKDFKQASKNVSYLVTTLTEGIMQAYEEHPDWYEDGGGLMSLIGGMFGQCNSPLGKVIKQSKMLGPLISKIAEAVKDYADLKVATRWDKEGKPIAYRHLKDKDFDKASENVTKILITLTRGIMTVYEEHPEWYSGGLFSKSPLKKVIDVDQKLSKLVSTVAESVKDYASMTVPTHWNKEGQADKFRVLKDKDFDDAGNNVVKILVTLGNGIMTVYQEHEDWFKGGGFLGMGDSPFQKVIETDTKLSELVSNVAGAVKDYAALMIPTKWNKEGKAVSYRQMTPDEFIQAGANIGNIVCTVAMGIMGYDKDGNATAAQPFIQKYMIDGDEEDFQKIVDNAVKIGDLVSGMADGIAKYAQMMIPDKWDKKTGNAIHYRTMTDADFTTAAEGISKIIITVAQALGDTWEGNEKLFGWDPDEEEWMEDAPIKHVLDASVSMGAVISGIADGLAKYAELKVPVKWDKEGKPVKFEKMDGAMFQQAADNVTKVITTIASTFVTIYNANPWMFKVPTKTVKKGGIAGLFGATEEVPTDTMSPFERVTAASVQMATVICGIADALQKYASKTVVGPNNEVVQITDQTIDLANKAVVSVLTTLANTFADMRNNPKFNKLFQPEVVENVIEPISEMVGVVSGIANAIQSMALLKIPTEWDEKGDPKKFRQMNTADFLAAGVNMQLILTAIADAFFAIAGDPRNTWITNSKKHKKTVRSFFGGLFSSTVEEEESGGGDSDGISEILEGISTLATILNIISGCIYGYATLSFPMGTDDKGQVKYSKPLTPQQLQASKDNIRMVVCSLAEAMDMVLKDQFIQNMISEQTQEQMDNLATGVDTLVETMTGVIGSIQQLTESDEAKTLPTVRNALKRMVPVLGKVIEYISQLLALLISNNSSTAISTQSVLGSLELNYSFADLIQQYSDKFDNISDAVDKFTDMLIDVIEEIADLRDPIKNSLARINELYKIFTKENLNAKVNTIITSIGQMLVSFKQVSMFDEIFAGEINEEDLVDRTAVGQAVEALTFGHVQLDNRKDLSKEQEERAEKEIERLMRKLVIYTDLVEFVVYRLRKMNEAINGLQIANYFVFVSAINGFFMAVTLIKNSLNNTEVDQVMSITVMIEMYSRALNKLISVAARTQILGDVNFETLTNGIININAAIAQVNTKSIAMFMLQTIQLDRFVKTINSIKLINLLNLNKFVDSLNKLANKMGNLDKLTDALSNKLSKVLDKLVERLAHAENTIIKADEIQKRRHELIEKSVQEVSELMKQPMIVEIQQSGGGAAPTDAAATPPGTPAPSQGAGGTTPPANGTTNNNQTPQPQQ